MSSLVTTSLSTINQINHSVVNNQVMPRTSFVSTEGKSLRLKDDHRALVHYQECREFKDQDKPKVIKTKISREISLTDNIDQAVTSKI